MHAGDLREHPSGLTLAKLAYHIYRAMIIFIRIRNEGWHPPGRSLPVQKTRQPVKARQVAIHHIYPGRAVNMNVNKSRVKSFTGEIDLRDAADILGADPGYAPAFDQDGGPFEFPARHYNVGVFEQQAFHVSIIKEKCPRRSFKQRER
jgi:hypothetical protein